MTNLSLDPNQSQLLKQINDFKEVLKQINNLNKKLDYHEKYLIKINNVLQNIQNRLKY
jgi:hypothetical protein